MNFLAHTLYGFGDEALITGQLCADYVRGRDLSHFPDRIALGIRLHRLLDARIDQHPALLTIRSEMRGVPRRFAGIVTDVMFDHYLAQRWKCVSTLSLDEHAHQVHQALEHNERYLPEPLLLFKASLLEKSILQNNSHLTYIERTLSRIANRSTLFKPVAIPLEELQVLQYQLIESFDLVYPDMTTLARDFVRKNDPLLDLPTKVGCGLNKL